MKKTLLVLSTTALLLGASATTFAAKPYLIGEIGKSDYDIDHYDGDESDTYFGLGVGFDVSRNLAFEVTYKDFGKISDGPYSLEGSAFNVSAVGKLPLNASFELLGKVGVDLWKTDVSGPGSDDDDGFDLSLAVGGAFNIDSRSAITLTYELHEWDHVNVDVLAVGINYGF